MGIICDYMESDHKRCDALFEQLETSLDKQQWEQAALELSSFKQALERHFAMEENVLFVAFEQAAGNSAGPTAVMRLEHQHMRSILSRLIDAVGARDMNDFFGHADTLRIMMQQHNLKEESILYLMTDRFLAGRQGAIIEAMQAVDLIAAIE